MRDISFYRDAQFYPPEHPRRRGRINSIHEKLVTHERKFRTTIHLQPMWAPGYLGSSCAGIVSSELVLVSLYQRLPPVSNPGG